MVDWLGRLVYCKVCVSRAYEHVYLPVSLINSTLLSLVVLKAYGFNKPWLAVPVIIGGLILLVFIGHYDLKKGVYARETKLRNQHNPEIQRLLEDNK